MSQVDVAIADAGPTGLALFNLLGMRGATLLIERNPESVSGARAWKVGVAARLAVMLGAAPPLRQAV